MPVAGTSAIAAPTTSPTGTVPARATRAASATVDYNQFLQLLVAEMRHQDPTNPTDPTEHVSQLASFSAVEQQVRTNTILGSLLAAQAEQLIGRSITNTDGTTRGIVTSVTISPDNRVSATLEDGTSVTLGDGLTIGAA